jgi:hypothetical protein
MTDKAKFMAEMHHHLPGGNEYSDTPVSPPTVSMRHDVIRADDQIPNKDKPPCHRTNHTSWRGGAKRR